jgi:hypothetical protein
LSNCFLKFGRVESALFFYGQKLRSLRFEQMSRKEVEFHFAELKTKFLQGLFPENHFLLGIISIIGLFI